jgi:hypothetical protein
MNCPRFFYILTVTALLHLFFFTALYGQHGLVINEIMSSNRSAIMDEDGDYPDWIELYNAGNDEIDLLGWGLSDTYQELHRWVFPSYIISPGDHLLVWASGKNRKETPVHHEIIVAEKSVWKYLDDGSNQGTQWRTSGFDDSAWPQGPAMLGYDTNNGTVFGTTLKFGDRTDYKHITYYFRKEIEIGDLSRYDNFQLKLMIDDGAVVYVNGQELMRANMPLGTIYFNTFADIVVTSLDIFEYVIPKSVFVKGKNTIAVEVHQVNRTSSDLRFDMELKSKGRFLHTNFSIRSEGEPIVLSHPLNGAVDSIPAILLPSDVSYGRYPDGTNDFAFYTTSTPGKANSEERYLEFVAPPVFSHTAGFYSAPFNLSISSASPDATIIYTLDGSIPDPANLQGNTFEYKNSFPGTMLVKEYKSFTYTEPLPIADRTPLAEDIATFASDYNGSRYTSSTQRLYKGTIIRAVAVKEGAINSPEITASYFIHPNPETRYQFPVISLITQASNLFDYSIGIYTPGKVWEEQGRNERNGGAPANYNRRDATWERTAYMEFFDGSVTAPVISQLIGIRTHGAWSRAHAMKSLRLYARTGYGEDYLNHKMFPKLPFNQYKNVVIRNSGNDWGRTLFLDAAAQTVVSGLRMDTQAYRPIILFINGEYWGIHNLRERYDKHYLNRVYGVDENNIDYLEINAGQASEGDRIHYNSTTSYLENNNMALKAHYDHARTLIDIENFIDYQISHIYIANTDWPGNNNHFWRVRTPYKPFAPYGHDGRWRWLVFDTDFGFNGSNNATHNTLIHATSPTLIWQNPPHSTLILRRLLLNESFKFDFISRFADLLNTHFKSDRASAIINQMRRDLEPEMQEHITRWNRPGSINDWNNLVNGMSNFVLHRPSQVRGHIQTHFNLAGQFQLTLNVSDPAHGYIRVNSVELKQGTPGVAANTYPWVGTYFIGVPIELEAIALPGYTFSHWEGAGIFTTPIIRRTINTTSSSFRAYFHKSDLIHNWHFNFLKEGALEQVPSSYSATGQGVITYPGTGAGFIDRVNGGTDLNITDGAPAGYGLRVRNPSDTRELIIHAPTTGYQNIVLSYAAMRTPLGAEIHEIHYKVSSTGSWLLLKDMIRVSEDWSVFRFTFNDPLASNNENLEIRIRFRGDATMGESGNTRFDNIKVEGMDVKYVGLFDESTETSPNTNSELNIRHSSGMIHLDNPYHGNSTLLIFTSGGKLVKEFPMSGQGHHSMGFIAAKGIYVARLASHQGISTARFVVMD